MKPNPKRDLFTEYKSKKYARIPVETHFVEIGESLDELAEKYFKPELKDGDIAAIACKIVSICTPGLTVQKDDVRISWLAKLIVKFVKKWPNDIGYSNPRKMQVAINIAGYPRMIFAVIGGTFMKLLGKPGYFYRLAGNRINAIDGFTVGFTSKKLFEENAFLPPSAEQGDEICNRLEQFLKAPVVILDGNNIDNHVMGMSNSAKKQFTQKEFEEIVSGNPQGQEDDGNNTPLLIVREIKD